MKMSHFHTLVTKSNLFGSKLILGGVTAVVAAIVGTAGVAAAQSTTGDSSMPNVATCKTQYKDYDFDSTSQCINWRKHHQGSGYGYGGESHHHKHHHHFHNFFADWWRHYSSHH